MFLQDCAAGEPWSQTGIQSARESAAYAPVEPSQGLCNKLAHRPSRRDNGLFAFEGVGVLGGVGRVVVV